MRILRSEDIAIDSADRIFRQSPDTGLFAAMAFVAAAAAAGAAAWQGVIPAPVTWAVVATLLCFAMIAGFTYRRSATSSSWLLATRGTTLWIQLRSHLNHGDGKDAGHVLELSAEEIAGFRVTGSSIQGHGPSNDAADRVTTFLDLVVIPPTDELAAMLTAERTSAKAAHWRHYPVTLPWPDTLRLEWRGRYGRIDPSIDEAVKLMAAIARPLPPAAENIDLGTAARAPSAANLERDIRLLAEQGQILEATTLAVRGLGMSLTDARNLVRAWSAERIAPGRDPE